MGILVPYYGTNLFFNNLPAARVARTGHEQDEFCQELIMYLGLVRRNIPPYRSINY